MRAVGDPDVYLASDLGVKHALTALPHRTQLDPSAAAPWRSYLTHHIWATLGDQDAQSNKGNRP
jgi:AraC family transcriptional regulator of adaptative response / DNA-3-methyladenine glycosylase II